MTWSVYAVVGGPPLGRGFTATSGLGVSILHDVFLLTWPMLVFWTFTTLFLRLRRPRPDWRELIRQPGMTACVAASASLVFASWLEWVFHVRVPIATVSVAVSSAWLALVIGRAWKAERSWIDRIGRLVGVGWIAIGPLGLI